SKIAYDTVNARDCLSLLASLDVIPLVREHLKSFHAPLIAQAEEQLDALEDLKSVLRKAISPDAPLSVRDGGLILEGYNAELDELRTISKHGKEYLADLERRERDATGIKN